ncbi:MAG: hypothetical protein CL947_00010 [Epsilonproteobacteria bacterium]|nr:hypothetical protein [Campylobacterota bacterium]|tara:strand:+ start:4644 stop:5228 length:585 start_codon:yes stop_codon:yes gene_type:complete
MKRNYFLYVVYILYALIISLVTKTILFTAEGALLVVALVWLIPPIAIALIPIIYIKRFMLRQLIPTITNAGALAVHGTLRSLGLDVIFSLVLAFLASMVRMAVGDIANFELFGTPQTIEVIFIEVCCFIVIFAWLSRMFEYHMIWYKIQKELHKRVKRVLFYANILGYMLITICFIIWQLMIFYQVPEWLWQWL